MILQKSFSSIGKSKNKEPKTKRVRRTDRRPASLDQEGQEGSQRMDVTRSRGL